MRRAALALAAPAAGLAVLLRFKYGTSPPGAPGRGPAGPRPGASRSALPGPGPSQPASGPSGTRTVTGAAVSIPFGPVQVAVTLDGSRILAVKSVQMPTDYSQSAYIASVAAPLLAREVVAAQSARINVVSGATYDSYGYAQSVQSALDRARAGAG